MSKHDWMLALMICKVQLAAVLICVLCHYGVLSW